MSESGKPKIYCLELDETNKEIWYRKKCYSVVKKKYDDKKLVIFISCKDKIQFLKNFI